MADLKQIGLLILLGKNISIPVGGKWITNDSLPGW